MPKLTPKQVNLLRISQKNIHFQYSDIMERLEKEIVAHGVDINSTLDDVITRFKQMHGSKQNYMKFVADFKVNINAAADISRFCRKARGIGWVKAPAVYTEETAEDGKKYIKREQGIMFEDDLLDLQSVFQSYHARLAEVTRLYLGLRVAGKYWRRQVSEKSTPSSS